MVSLVSRGPPTQHVNQEILHPVVCLRSCSRVGGSGHDGMLCELGYDKDGDGERVSGCG